MSDSHKTLHGKVFEMGDIEMSEETRMDIKRFENYRGRCIYTAFPTNSEEVK